MASTETTRPTSARAQELADQFETVNAEVVSWVQQADAAQWGATTSAEGWPVPAAAMHIAFTHLVVPPWVRRISCGLPVVETFDEIAVMNAADAEKYAAMTQQEAAEHLTLFGAAAAKYVRGLTDEELAGSGLMGPVGTEISAAALIENVLIGHPRTHLASMRG
jgi:hypothetical protein